MDFTSAKRKKKELDEKCTATPTCEPPADRDVQDVTPVQSSSTGTGARAVATPSIHEIADFHAKLNDCEHKPAILSIIPQFADAFTCDTQFNVLPLTSLFKQDYASLSVAELITAAETVNVTVSDDDIELIELATRTQSTSQDWYLYRAGRITASNFKEACCTDPEKPSVSLLKRICYPGEHRFKALATDWGLSHESVALSKYKEYFSSHIDVSVYKCGLIINRDFAFLGASPDAFVSCCCCQCGTVEIKCPYKYRWMNIPEYLAATDTCFELGATGVELKKTHPYYYQVQAQMHVCDVKYCDFVVCTFPSNEATIFVIRIFQDNSFWLECFHKSSTFFRTCVLPELLGKAYTRQVRHNTSC